MTAHRVTGDRLSRHIGREFVGDELWELVVDIAPHSVVLRPRLFGRIDVEARAKPEIIVVAVRHAFPPRAGVRSNEDEPELGARGATLALLGDVGMRAGEPW